MVRRATMGDHHLVIARPELLRQNGMGEVHVLRRAAPGDHGPAGMGARPRRSDPREIPRVTAGGSPGDKAIPPRLGRYLHM